MSRGGQDTAVKMLPSWQNVVSYGDLICCRSILLLAFGTWCEGTGRMDRDCHPPCHWTEPAAISALQSPNSFAQILHFRL